MSELIDFSNCKRVHRHYGGTDRKFPVEYNGEVYLLKFSDDHAKKTDISTSAVNNVVSEYISSHISNSLGLPTHETILGLYKDELVVGCKDFRAKGEQNLEFRELAKAVYGSSDLTRHVILSQVYETLFNPINEIKTEFVVKSIERFWDTFVADALVGNFDRHMGNWGYITVDDEISRLAPVYDYGSTLFPNLSDDGAAEYIHNDFEMLNRCIVFPSPVLCVTKKKVGKVGYYDMLSSNYDENCTEALLRITPKISMDKINCIIDQTPLIADTRKTFYKAILALRKKVIIDRAYQCCLTKNFDQQSYENICVGHQRNKSDIDALLQNPEINDFLQSLNREIAYNQKAQISYSAVKKTKQVDFTKK